MNKRIDKVQRELKEKKKNTGFYITSPYNLQYLSDINTSGSIIIIAPVKAYYLADFRYIEYVKKELSADFTVIMFEKEYKDRIEQLKEIVKDEDLETILYEESTILFREKKVIEGIFKDYTLEESGGMLTRFRNIKDDMEISNIIESQKITDSAFDHIIKFISENKNNLTENDIAFELEFFMRKNGADRNIAFDIICVSGVKSSLPHGEPGDVKLSQGFLTMDFGAKVNGYCTDMTRTICIGKPDNEMTLIYNTVKTAQQAALDTIYSGIIGGTVDTVARNVIKNAGYEKCFAHGLGHGVGLEIHEPLGYGKNKLPAGGVITVEPGIYLENKYGVRIEDIILLKEYGYKNFTKSTKELIIL